MTEEPLTTPELATDDAGRKNAANGAKDFRPTMPEYSTLAEVAASLQFRPRRLREIIKRHSIPVLRAGRDIRFDAIALRALEEAMRAPSSEPTTTPLRRARTASLPMSPEAALAAVLEATSRPSRPKDIAARADAGRALKKRPSRMAGPGSPSPRRRLAPRGRDK